MVYTAVLCAARAGLFPGLGGATRAGLFPGLGGGTLLAVFCTDGGVGRLGGVAFSAAAGSGLGGGGLLASCLTLLSDLEVTR